jgi:redox-sensitive bicupin YhaK (pirin superfamily)
MADPTVAAETCVALGATEHQFESFPGRDIALGALTVTRVLPVKGKRLVGPWCFLDRFGPLTFADPSPMDVGAHPHMGLQTVTWLLDGELVHYDSLGSEPRQLSVDADEGINSADAYFGAKKIFCNTA